LTDNIVINNIVDREHLMPVSPMEDNRDRALGAFIGLATGDAIGTTVEFRPRGSFSPLTDMVGGGPFRLRAGQWTDDTSMAVCLAESQLMYPDLDPIDLMTRFLAWRDDGVNSSTGTCFDIGITTRAALDQFKRTHIPLAGDTDPHTAGNGSVMRLAPVALSWWRDPVKADEVARTQGRTTHGSAEAVDGCALLARVLCRLIAGEGKSALSEDDPAWSAAIRVIGQGGWRGKQSDAIRSSGYVVHTLEAAFWVVDQAENFHDAVLAAANLGDDADTVAAVTGQLAGALWGYSAIPTGWLEKLHDHDRLTELGNALFDAGGLA
jgi:ADP-ribosyl-[dinitrogen reductase] hydrolase